MCAHKSRSFSTARAAAAAAAAEAVEAEARAEAAARRLGLGPSSSSSPPSTPSLSSERSPGSALQERTAIASERTSENSYGQGIAAAATATGEDAKITTEVPEASSRTAPQQEAATALVASASSASSEDAHRQQQKPGPDESRAPSSSSSSRGLAFTSRSREEGQQLPEAAGLASLPPLPPVVISKAQVQCVSDCASPINTVCVVQSASVIHGIQICLYVIQTACVFRARV